MSVADAARALGLTEQRVYQLLKARWADLRGANLEGANGR